jgi:hypothetical protein
MVAQDTAADDPATAAEPGLDMVAAADGPQVVVGT